ncbi:unnamed protein product [Bursaphelenchus okinawaensis]|uniref:Lipase n=1 Tax=Bursaphelenchus okinawaensis TaxID=465554 RepID=A0A811KST2_9BILA|nr:unnamed protein product [Bursaphelenchus okinawaensis]CAG9111998.1 unnamed protein product [Bursaphelenchus okinawaensis]
MGLIHHWGYVGEEHIAQTEDGWLLKLHRIPQGINEYSKTSNKPVIILQHGLQCSSDNWVLNLPHQSAGFVFADEGFDVWMVNSRGNTYTEHTKYKRDDEEFWKFTSDDMQKYDLPAVFDLIEKVTNQSHFYYLGHSQGTYIMFAKLSEDFNFNHRIKKFFALGPGIRFKNIKGSFDFLYDTTTYPITSSLWNSLAYSQLGKPILSQETVKILTDWTCKTPLQRQYCAHVFYWFCGPSTTTNTTRMPVYTTHIPAGSSTANVQKYCQSRDKDTGGFRKYRYPTVEENLKEYGQIDPPFYNLTNLNVPLYLYSCPDDHLTTQKQLDEDLIPSLRPGVLKEDNRYPGLSHMDLLWSLNATERVYKKIIETIRLDVL